MQRKKNQPVPDFAQRLIVILFHLLVLTVPFFFTWVNEELFEFNKMLLVYGFTIVISLVWIWRMILHRRVIYQHSYLGWPILAFLSSQVISTIFSIHPHTSVFGYYTRFNGGLLSTISYITLFYAFSSNFNKKQIKGLLVSIFIGALGVSLYAIPEHFGHSLSCLMIGGDFGVDCWVQKVQERVFGTFGQPNWLAAYAILLLPVGVSLFVNRQIEPKKQAINQLLGLFAGGVTIALLLTTIFTQSRSGFLGLAVAMIGWLVGFGLLFWRDYQSEVSGFPWLNSLKIFGLLAILVVVFGSPYTPKLASLLKNQITSPPEIVEPAQPVGNRLEVGGTDSGEIRSIVWQGALAVWRRYPIFGSGVETFAYSYYRDRPMAHNLVSEWDFLYNKAHNELLNYLATTGLVGLFTYLSMFIWYGYKVVGFMLQSDKKHQKIADKILVLGLTSGLIALFISNALGFSTVMVTTLMFIFFAIFGILERVEPSELETPRLNLVTKDKLILGLATAGAIFLLFQVVNIWRADYLYNLGERLLATGQISRGEPLIERAIRLRPNEELFYDKYASVLAQAAILFVDQKKLTEAQNAAQHAIAMSNKALKLNPVHLNLYKTRIRLFSTLGTLDNQLLEHALSTSLEAMKLSPTDPKLVFNLGLINQAMGNDEKALENYQRAIAMKPNYVQVRKYLADFYLQRQEPKLAFEQLNEILTYFPDDQEVKQLIASISTQVSPN